VLSALATSGAVDSQEDADGFYGTPVRNGQPGAAHAHGQRNGGNKLRQRTRDDYQKIIRKIEDGFGDLPIAALNDPRVTKDFLDWRDSMASSPRQADYAWTVLKLIIAWARGRALTTYRPPERVERL
jgi:hypothetical protein